MMRWVILAVLVVVISATATLVVQSLSAGSHEGNIPDGFPAPSGKSSTVTGEPSGPPPRAVVEGDLTYLFGVKAQHVTFSKDWTVKNEGAGELILKLLQKDCNCTTVEFRGKDGKTKQLAGEGETAVLAPGEAGTIHLLWETREPTNPKFHKAAILGTNDLDHPKFIFAAEGMIHPAVVVFPEPAVKMLDISTDEESHKAGLAVFSADRPDMKITKLASSNPELVVATQQPLTAEDCKALKVEKGIRLNIDVKRGLPLGVFREEVILATDHPLKPEVRVPITGKMVGPVTLIPDRVEMKNVSAKAGGARTMTLLVRNHRATKFQVGSKPEKLKVDIVASDNDPKVSKYLMTVTVPPGTAPGTIEDVIVLKSDHPQAAELRIPVLLFVGDAG